MLPVAAAQWHCVNHQQALILEFNCHYLQGHALCVISEKDKSLIGAERSIIRSVLLEEQAAMLDDMA